MAPTANTVREILLRRIDTLYAEYGSDVTRADVEEMIKDVVDYDRDTDGRRERLLNSVDSLYAEYGSDVTRADVEEMVKGSV